MFSQMRSKLTTKTAELRQLRCVFVFLSMHLAKDLTHQSSISINSILCVNICLTLSVSVPRWAGDNTGLSSNSNISKAVRVKHCLHKDVF